ncbi:MAG TPA: DUF1194 domain-containing protein [Alphaproteobacteria bacterium]
MTRPLRLVAILSLAVLGWGLGRPAVAEPVDLHLVLAVDVSRSIDEAEYQLQRKGYAAALTDARVLQVIRSGENRRIAICYFEWSGESYQQVIVDWTVVGDLETAADVANQLLTVPRPFANRTSLGVAIDFATAQFQRSPHQGGRRIIDVSGDGTNTNGIEPSVARDAAMALGVTINGLVILNTQEMPWMPWHTHPPGGLDEYYRQNVAGGPGAFVMVAEDFDAFASAIINKLVREIADAGGTKGGRAVAAAP